MSVILPRYRCHKEVWAGKIAHIDYRHDGDGGAVVVFAEGHDRFYVSQAYVDKHKPKPGGYYVRYDDGYESWSPAGAFESGYTRIEE